ncbi:hypothetical protein VTL71DRAFT_1155 [Oculimacula yallundae]|uniref:Uncharacterized protein n=1 Tax=Oculimacula yallundae TaxID=86028 RepID=A0ABR4D216_9HELO
MAAPSEDSSSTFAKTPRSKSASPPIIELRFIDETQRQNSSQIRKEIRSHVRKASHERQRRLNAAAKARPLEGARVLLQKQKQKKEEEEGSDSPSRAKMLPSLQQLQITEARHSEGSMSSGANTPVETVVEWDFPPREEVRTEFGSREMELTKTDLPDDYSGPVDHLISSGNSSPSAPCMDLEMVAPYALVLGGDGPVLQMRSQNWPFPRIFSKKPGVSVWMPGSVIPVPELGSRPSLLKSSKVVPWICNSAEYFCFKEETIRWVNKRLDNDPTHEMTIGGIMCLMSWEIARGNVEETALHMDGLVRIVTMKGGLKRLCPIKQFCWKIHLIDLIVAVTTTTRPRFWDQNPQKPAIYTNLSNQIADSPLHGTMDFGSSSFCPATLILLQEMRDLTNGVKATLSRGTGTGLFPIIDAASSIYRRAFLKVPFDSPCNSKDVERICELLEDHSADETWVKYPGLLMWILLVGMSAAKRERRSFLTMFLYRVGTTAVWWGMDECTMAVMTFLRVKRRAEE